MILHEVKNFFKIIQLHPLRRTPNVTFDALDRDEIPQVDAFDRVMHQSGAISPGPVEGIDRPWYMHPYQEDNLMVLYGTRDESHGLIDIMVCHGFESMGRFCHSVTRSISISDFKNCPAP